MVIALVASLTLVAVPQVLAASTWYVDINACPGPGAGTQIDPFCEIQAAVDAASDGDTILVAEGTYEETIEWLYKNLTIIGAGTENTIIDGGESGTVITVDGVDNSRLEGFTITNGDAPMGGGMNIGEVGELIVEDCVFEWNYASQGGGGVNYGFSGDSPTFINCHFLNNEAGCSGGGMRANGHATLIDCVFDGNSANDWGGGLKTGCEGDLDVSNCTFTNNDARWGGGIAVDGACALANVTGCVFINNFASLTGGGVYAGYNPDCGLATITSNVFWNNEADGLGGGFYASTEAIVTNCTFVENYANGTGSIAPYYGGGLYDSSLSSKVTNCIFWGNVGFDENDQIYPPAGAAGPPPTTPPPTTFPPITFEPVNRDGNPDLAGLASKNGESGEGTSITYCNVMGGYEGTGNISGSPMFVDPGCGNFHLQENSPCIDKGTGNAPGLPDDDLDGQARVMGGSPDIGADEYEQYGGGGGPTVGGKVMMIDKARLMTQLLNLPMQLIMVFAF